MILDAERKATEGEGLKILIPKQMFQRLPIAIAHVQTNNTSEKWTNEIWHVICSLYQSK